VRDLNGHALKRIEFDNRPGFRFTDAATGLFFQDNWQLRSGLTFDAGLRADTQSITGTVRLAPRIGAAWSPFGDSQLVVRSGFGWFYDPVPLSIYAFDHYPARVVTRFRPDGSIRDGPRAFTNLIGTAGSGDGPLVFGSRQAGNFAPRSRTWSLQLERRFRRVVRLRATYRRSRSAGLMVVRPEVVESRGVLLLSGDGGALQRHLELVSRFRCGPGREFFGSYVYSWSRGNLNDFTGFLGNYPAPLVRPDMVAETSGNIPHRVLAWGVWRLGEKWQIAPVIEYRTGYPYTAVTEAQDYAGPPNSRRFPRFFSLDFRISRDIRYRKHMFRVSFSLFNLTNHFNPDSVRLNTADPQFGEFLGQHKRRFRLDFDFLF